MNQHTVINKRTFCLQQPKYIYHTSGQSERHNLFDRKFLPIIENHFKVNVTNFPCEGFYQNVVRMSVSETDQVSNHGIVGKRSSKHRFCIVSNFRCGESKPEKLVQWRNLKFLKFVKSELIVTALLFFLKFYLFSRNILTYHDRKPEYIPIGLHQSLHSIGVFDPLHDPALLAQQVYLVSLEFDVSPGCLEVMLVGEVDPVHVVLKFALHSEVCFVKFQNESINFAVSSLDFNLKWLVF